MKEAFDLTDEMIMITDEAVKPSRCEVLYVNEAFADFTGYTTEELKDLSMVQSPDIDPQTLSLYMKARENKEPFRGFILGEKKSGDYFWVDLTLTPYHGAENDRWFFIHKPRLVNEYELIKDRARLMGWTEISAEMARIGMWEMYPNTGKAFFSDSMYRMLGLEGAGVQPSFEIYKDLILDEDRPLVDKSMERIRDSGDPESYLHRIRRADTGELRYLRGYAKRYAAEGGYIKLYGIIQDVTKYREKQKELAIFKQAVDSTNSGIVLSDYQADEMPIIYCNHTFRQMTGYSEDEVRGRNCRFLQGNDRKQEARWTLREALQKGEPASVEIRNYTKNGGMFWNHLNIAPIRNDDGEITHYVGVQEDITEEVRMRERLEEAEKKWEKLVQMNPDLIAMHKNGKITFINDAGIRMFGLKNASELIGTSVFEVIHEDDHSIMKDRMKRLSKGKVMDYFTYRLITPSGEIRYLRSKSLPIRHDGEQMILTVGQDITEQQRDRQQLRDLLEQKQILIKEIHHRVKNNMAIVSGLLDLQKQSLTDPQAIEALTNSQLRIHTMAQIHEQLYKEQDLADITSNTYLENLLSHIQDVYTDRPVSVDTKIEAFELNVNQAIPLGLLLNELIINAYKHAFSAHEEGFIQIELRKKEQEVVARVSDNGKGMPEMVDHENPDTLGYMIIHTLKKQLSATLNVDSDERGTMVEVRFEREKPRGSSSNIQRDIIGE